MKSLFFGLGSILLLLVITSSLFHEPPVGETVTASRLSDAAELASAYPTECAPFLAKIRLGTLTNADFVNLKSAIEPAKARAENAAAEQLHKDSPVSWWLLDGGGAWKIFAVFFGVFSLLQMVKDFSVTFYRYRADL